MKTSSKTQSKNNQFSRFLHVEIAKSSKQNESLARTEVIGYAMIDGKKAPRPRKGYEDYKALLEKLHKDGELSSSSGSGNFVRYSGLRRCEHILFVNLGKDRDGVNAIGAIERVKRLGALTAQKLQAERSSSAAVYLESFLSKEASLQVDEETLAYAFTEGFALTCYRFNKYITQANATKSEPMKLILVASTASQASKFDKGMKKAQAFVTGVEICRDLGNEPSNELNPELYAKATAEIAKTYGLKYKVLDQKELAKEKMGLLLGVGQGSVNPPRLIVLEYKPTRAKKTIAFVGKGITFDSGGISIKPSARMEDMKHDMCGSAAVVGAIVTCALLKMNTHVIAVIAAAENMPDGNAIQPGNILRGRNGKTVEVINTDAEGRLVLADALDYVQDMNPDYIIDLATLTGAAIVTFGRACAGLMGNNEKFNSIVKQAASKSGERVWELPLFDEYFDDLKSDYADMRNSGDTPANGTAKGAMFLLQFIRKNTKWVHLDIASVSNGIPSIPYNPRKSSTGYGVKLLVNLADKVS